MSLADIGLIGMAVMGENLVLNMERNGFKVAVYNRIEPNEKTPVVSRFMANRGKGKNFIPTYSIEEFVKAVERPRKLMMMIRAGGPVDQVIEQLLPFVDQGDIIIDGGNSNFEDTIRREKYLKEKGIYFMGTGVSGGEEGALNGPSIMPGGDPKAWENVKPVFQSIAATVDGLPCCDYLGEDGAGHFVKMVHNGIEYGDMQIISEGYHLLKDVLKLSNDEISNIFATWNKTELNSYLIEITSEILAFKDEDGNPIVDKILDKAGQKGTGKWTGITALDIGVPLTLIGEAVFARCLSSFKNERVTASKVLKYEAPAFKGNKQEIINAIKNALYASKIISYAQGYHLFKEAAKEYNWNLNYAGIALLWRGGCIIRSGFLNKIAEAYQKNPALENLLLNGYFVEQMNKSQKGWRQVVNLAVEQGVPTPAISSALAFFDGYRSAVLPANLLQAQRDYFGAHTYERVDKPEGQFFHTNWTGTGGTTSSSTYNA
ncbi:MAG: decarboxylating NADP(+)-dependent phosphogluconate dehydrogenase [Bacteroidales bacterium]|nr:decarboxylating NADP(+)-dependent phosphogluconate dehydrogenase [Bacteroidales bacterium]